MTRPPNDNGGDHQAPAGGFIANMCFMLLSGLACLAFLTLDIMMIVHWWNIPGGGGDVTLAWFGLLLFAAITGYCALKFAMEIFHPSI